MATSDEQTPTEFARSAASSAWNTIRTVYWANSPGWRLLKAGSLLFMGFFLWAGSNVMFSYRPGWTPLQYTMAYGFLVIVYGPIHHLAVIPLALRWRRAAGRRQDIGKRLPNAGLALFLVAVVVLGTVPPAAMVVDFQSALGDSSPDIAPDLQCVKSDGENGTVVHCHLSESRGVESIEVRSGGEVILTDETAPYEFSVRVSELNAVMGEKKFTVALLDEDGDLVRRYTRRVNMINEG
jgi:hypothetical protein